MGAVHICQHLNEYTQKYTFSDSLQKVYISTFFKWTICNENDQNKMGENVEIV